MRKEKASKLLKIIDKYSIFFIIGGYLAINLWFNYRAFWHELIFDQSQVGAVYGEVRASEWMAEQIYQKLIAGMNPFTPLAKTLYPFGMDIVIGHPGNAFPFVFTRPFLSPHQSFMIIPALNLLLANVGMYLLLRGLSFSRVISFLLGLAYGYMTFLTPRMGHLDFTTIHLLPWFFFSAVTFYKSKKKWTKVLAAFGLTIFFVLTLWQNIYYFIILVIASSFLLLYYFLFNRKEIIKLARKNWQYAVFSVFIISILMLPWLKALYKTFLFSSAPRVGGWGGAIEFSSDLFGFFIPSNYNRYYGQFIPFLTQNLEFARGIFENFTYPGIIILLSYFFLFIFYKKIPQKLKENLKPYLLTSFVFLILTLGPFLHVFGRWWIQLEDGIRLVFPLPFVILHYLPFFSNIRAPGRFSVGFIFFAYIVVAYLTSYFLRNKSSKFKFVFFALFLAIVIFDQRYDDRGGPAAVFYPKNIYRQIRQDPAEVSVLEIPFSVRDGFTYFGDYNTILMTEGNFIHGKPVLGGYTGRISNYIKDYYQRDFFLGYLGRLIDLDAKNNPFLAGDINWQIPEASRSAAAIDFLDLKYVILNTEKSYSASASAFLADLKFAELMRDRHFTLLTRDPGQREFLDIKFNGEDDKLLLGFGWYPIEDDFRWVDRRSLVMFKVIEPRRFDLNIRAATFHQPQETTVYLNREKVAKIKLTTELRDYSIPIDKKFKTGINTVHFIFQRGYRPANVIPGSLDQRRLAAKFTRIFLSEKK